MATEQAPFRKLNAKLGGMLGEGESIVTVAQAWGGPRPLTILGFTNYAAGFRTLAFGGFALALLPTLLRFAGLVSLWLLVVTPTRLIAARRGGFTGTSVTEEVRSINYEEIDDIRLTDSFWSGWLLEVTTGRHLVKYAVMGPPREVEAVYLLHLKWQFNDFRDALVTSWRQARG
jgi:hypothetical protein